MRARGALLVRDEHHFDGGPASPPVNALDLLLAFIRTATVAPVARLRTVRRVVTVLGASGRPRWWPPLCKAGDMQRSNVHN